MDLLKKNLEALKDRCPEVFTWINEQDHDDRAEMIVSKDGNANLRIRGRKGKSILLYDMENPLEENDKHLQEIDFSSDRVTFILGFGLGYSAKFILEKMSPGHKVVVLENNATVLRLALSVCDFSQPIKDNALCFSWTDNESIKNCAARYAARKLQEDLIYIMNYKLKEVDKEYENTEKYLMESINSVLVGALTGLRNAQRLVINDLNNFPKFLLSSGINKLHKKFEKIPGIIISAGPSLEKNIHHLREAKGKAVLFATAPIVRIMLAYDIIPDFVVSIDFLEQNYKHFEGICELDIPLIHPCTLYHQIVEDYQGHGFVYQDGSVSYWLRQHWPFRGLSNAGGSVALHAFVVAILAGCDPIIFIGQDLAFSKKTHVEGAALARDIDISKDNKSLFWVDGTEGGKVPTNSAFVSYLRRFEEIISSIDNKCINSTEGGAAIKGTDVIPLKESIEEFCHEEVPTNSIIHESCIVKSVNYEGIIEDIQKKINEISRMQTLITRGLKTNKEIADRLKKNKIKDPKTDDILQKNYKISTEIQTFCEGFPLTTSFLRKEIHEINRSKYTCQSAESDKKAELEIGLKRNRFILRASQGVLKKTKSKLKELLQKVTEINKHLHRLSENEKDPAVHYEYGKLLAEIGLHRLAVEEYQKSLQLREKTNAHLDLAKSYLALEKIEAANQELKRYFDNGGHKKNAVKLQNEVDELGVKWRNLAEDYYQQDNWINAVLYARKLERASLYPEVAREIVSKCIERRDEKIRDMEKRKDQDLVEKEKEDKFKELVTRGRELMNNHDLDEAIDLFQKAIHEAPVAQDTLEAQSLLACCYSENNEIEKARKIFGQLMEEYPETGIFHLNLGRGYLRNGLYGQAIKEYEAAARKEERFYFLYFEIGSIYMQNGEYNKAIESFEKYLKYSPDSYELLAKVGTCYLAKGMLWKARKQYQEALTIKPDYEAAQMGLGKIEEMEQRVRLRKIAGGLQGDVEEQSATGGP